MSERFYTNCALQPGLVDLEGAEAHHLAVVCRLRPGDPLCLFNGDGHEYPARVQAVQRRHVSVEVLRVHSPERELRVPVAVAAPLPRADRAQFLVEKLTELGVRAFVPLSTARSVVHPREGRLDKLQRYVIEASKQCGRNVLLQIEPLTAWESYCRREDLQGIKVFGHPGGLPFAALRSDFAGAQAVNLAVGPEGGFTQEEADRARAAAWRPLDLGPRVLRVETAALVLASLTVGQ